MERPWAETRGRAQFSRPDRSPDSLSSCGGQGHIASVLARFSTLEGYASRNLRNGVGSAWADDRPPSWFSSEVERRQTRSSNKGASVRVRGLFGGDSQRDRKSVVLGK